MTRKEFLGKIGVGAAFVLTASCLGGCQDDTGLDGGDPMVDPNKVDFTLDLTASENAPLNNNGGFVVVNKVVVAKDNTGSFVAATRICSHQSLEQIIFQNDEFFCTAHGARFDKQGGGLNPNGANGLFIYNTELNGNNLRIFED